MEPSPIRDREHEPRAALAIARAFREIPYYVTAGRTPAPDGAALDETLRAAPLLTKHALRTTLPKVWVPEGRDVRAELASGEIELVETSGSTADRLRVLWDKGWWLRQEARAMRIHPAIRAAMDGELGAYKEAILTTPVCGPGACHAGDLTFEERLDEHRLFLNSRPDPTFWTSAAMDRMLDELERHGTIGLESDPTYLAVLAAHAASVKRKLDVRGFVQLTYSYTTQAHLRAIRRAYDGPIVQLYGASEVGVLFMEAEDGKLHHAPFTTHVELLRAKVATPGASDIALVVVTTMDRAVQPLVRFVVGDLVQVDWDGPRRYTTVPPLRSIEGRLQDAIVRPDGAIVTAGAIDRALGTIAEIAFFQANQRTLHSVEVDVVGPRETEALVYAKLSPLFGELSLTVRATSAIAAEPSGKFRVARRHVPIDMVKSFEGCEGIPS